MIDEDPIIKQEMSYIREKFPAIDNEVKIFKEKREAKTNEQLKLKQKFTDLWDQIYAGAIEAGILEDRRKEQIPIDFPDRRCPKSNDNGNNH